MKKLIALLLCFVMVLGVMTACGDDKKAEADVEIETPKGIVGTWKATVSLAEFADMDDLGEMADYIDVDKLTMTVVLKFDDDGECTLSIDEKSIDKMIDVMADGMEDYLKDVAKEAGMSYKELLSATGYSSVKEMIEDMGLAEELKESVGDANSTAEYTYEDGVLTIDGEEQDAELNGNTLTIDIDGMELKFKRS